VKKKFRFKLEGLLKLKKFKEQQLKVELGQINQEILKTKQDIIDLNGHITETFESQEELMKTSMNGQMARFFPYYIQAKREDIKNKENLLYSLDKKFNRKLVEMKEAIGETKVIGNLKEKKKLEHKKEKEKKEYEEIEELLRMRRPHKDKIA
jgi:flagellar protein FliJ